MDIGRLIALFALLSAFWVSVDTYLVWSVKSDSRAIMRDLEGILGESIEYGVYLGQLETLGTAVQMIRGDAIRKGCR